MRFWPSSTSIRSLRDTLWLFRKKRWRRSINSPTNLRRPSAGFFRESRGRWWRRRARPRSMSSRTTARKPTRPSSTSTSTSSPKFEGRGLDLGWQPMEAPASDLSALGQEIARLVAAPGPGQPAASREAHAPKPIIEPSAMTEPHAPGRFVSWWRSPASMAMIGEPRWWRERCGTRAWRSSTPACVRPPSRS